MNRQLGRLLDPVFRLWSPLLLLRAGIASSMLPKPTDAPTVEVPGPDPDRVLVIGGGIVVGFGVLSHELGLIGHIARQVSGLTGRGVGFDIVAGAELRIAELPARLSATRLESYDAVVVLMGVIDAVRRTSTRVWRRSLVAALEEIERRGSSGTRVVIVGVQPVRLVTTFDNLPGFFAELHGRALDRESMRVCSRFPFATFAPFTPRAEPTERYRSSDTYRSWATQVSPVVAATLQKCHPLGDQRNSSFSTQ